VGWLTSASLWAGCCLVLQSGADCPVAPHLERYAFAERQMGVTFRILLYAPDETTANVAAKAAYEEIDRLNRIMSDYDSDSELMRLCSGAEPGKPVKVSKDLVFVLSRAGELARRTDGAFDVTVGPLVRLWRRARRQKKLPSRERLKQARAHVGYEFVRLDRDAQTVTLLKAGMRLDLGGIAKGYAADRALAVVREHGIGRALVDGSGDISIGDPPPGKPGWRIAVGNRLGTLTSQSEQEGGAAEQVAEFLVLHNAAVATSGDAFQYVEIDGVRYSHLIDPHTGVGLTDHSTVTIIAPDGITADSLASAVSVLGPERGMKLIETTPGCAARIVRVPRGEIQLFRSKGWPTAVVPQ
jgi:thiamine biosynthesis lipoprotein